MKKILEVVKVISPKESKETKNIISKFYILLVIPISGDYLTNKPSPLYIYQNSFFSSELYERIKKKEITKGSFIQGEIIKLRVNEFTSGNIIKNTTRMGITYTDPKFKYRIIKYLAFLFNKLIKDGIFPYKK